MTDLNILATQVQPVFGTDPEVCVILTGSRAAGKHVKNSDVDLLIVGKADDIQKPGTTKNCITERQKMEH